MKRVSKSFDFSHNLSSFPETLPNKLRSTQIEFLTISYNSKELSIYCILI